MLEKADSAEFARWWVVYRNTNEDFSQSFAEQYQDIIDVPHCHWIMRDRQRVGGIIRVPNNVGDFFLIPPFDDAYAALKAILPTDESLHARSILTEHVPDFQRFGFQIEESRRWMLCPTQAYSVTFDLPRSTPEANQSDTIADLMLAAFAGGVGDYGRRDVDAHRKSVASYFEHIQSGDVCHGASSVVLDGDQMVAACLVQPYKSLATIRFVVTHPDYQRRGLARRLMQFASDTIKDDYDYLGLAVTIGNPAQALYHDMGFVSGTATHTLVR